MSVKVARNRLAERELINRIRDKNTKDRKPGLHLTDLLYCGRKAWLRNEQVKAGTRQPPDDDSILTFAFGWAMHWLMEESNEESKQLEGLWYTPDEISLVLKDGDPTKKIVVDFKGTRKSSRKGPSDLGNYVDQIASYCLFEGTNLGRLQVLYYVGQYSSKDVVTKSDGTVESPRPFSPQHRAYDLEFDEPELMSWANELGRRRRMVEESTALEKIPVEEHFDWECQYCEFYGKECAGGKGTRLPWFSVDEQMDVE